MKIVTDTKTQGVVVLDDDNSFLTATTLANFSQVISSSFNTFDTGFMPKDETGLLSYRHAGPFAQIVYQIEAGFQLVKWGDYEEDDGAETVNLAHPYKIWVADFYNHRLVGLRHFASPEPIYSLDDPLYHLPLPNTNCTTYQGTSVGWVCLYQTGSTDLVTLQDKIHYAFERESGLHEPYNNNNMSETDGPRFYQDRDIPFYESPSSWIQKTTSEGSDAWIRREENLIVIKTNDPPAGHDDKGEIYTLGRAINNPYNPYYPSRLSVEQKAFYSNGWLKNLDGNYEFSPQTMSRLSSAQAPDGLDVEELMSSLNLEDKKLLDFNLWTSEKKIFLSNLILNMRINCCLCGSNDFGTDTDLEDMKVIIAFYSALVKEEVKSNSYVNCDNDVGFLNLRHYEYDLYNTLTEIELNEDDAEEYNFTPSEAPEKDYYICSDCVVDHTFRITFADGRNRLIFNKEGIEIFLDTNQCYSEMMGNYHEAIDQGYISYQDFSLYADMIFTGDVLNPGSYNIVPESHILTCFCQRTYELTYSNTGVVIPRAFESSFYLAPQNIGQVRIVRYCPSCMPHLSNFISKEMILSATTVPKLISEYNNFTIDSDKTHVVIRNTIKASFASKAIWESKEWIDYVEISHKLDLPSNYYYGIVYINGSPTFVVDRLEEFDQVTELFDGTMVYGEYESTVDSEEVMIPIIYPESFNSYLDPSESEDDS